VSRIDLRLGRTNERGRARTCLLRAVGGQQGKRVTTFWKMLAGRLI
jgi:hypothetical protein